MSKFLEMVSRRVLFFDGAMGTAILDHDLDVETDFLGKENCTEILVRTRPEVIQDIHESFLAIGADAVETDTFGANELVLAEFDIPDQTQALNREAAQLARQACNKYTSDDKPRFVIGSIGPGTKLITLGQTDWDRMFASYRTQAVGLLEGGADVLLIETAQDLLQVKCAVSAALAAMEACKLKPAVQPGDGGDIPIMVQVTIEQTGTMLVGTEISAAAHALAGFPIMSLGLNCATGPTEMTEHVQWLSKHWRRMISVLPNAGLPVLVEGRADFPLKPQPFAEAMYRFVDQYGVNIAGGCCGTTAEHIGKLIEAVGQRASARMDKDPQRPSCTSLYGPTEFRQDTSILNIGERTNASGSRAFKRMLEAEDWDGIVSLARTQVREGSHVIDLNVDYAGRDNVADMERIVSDFSRQVSAPLMLDSTQAKTIEAGLKCAGGKCIINSANLEDGPEKFGVLCKLARSYGAALVLGTIDEDPEEAMARTAERKISIARRMHDLAVNEYGLAADDLFFDPLVLPISTGMEKDRRSGLETIKGVALIAEQLPQCQITVGLSNISFGLKPAARQVLNSVFLAELVEAGLTSGILHATKILPRNKIADQQWQAAMDLIYDRRPEKPVALADGSKTDDPLQIFIDLFPDGTATAAKVADISTLPLEERLAKHIIDGEKQGLVVALDEALTKYDPLIIVNEHLLGGMKVVGELFGSGQMQLPFVLQSAEVMKMAVSHLEPHMEKLEGQTKGSIVLATVKGDVHDIGKNLVDIILTNNGYTVYNLGIKQPISSILDAWREHNADAIGLSGLLVKSVNVMEDNLGELNAQQVNVPVLLGGAALSRHYCESHLRNVYEGQVYHGRDAFEGLRIMDYLKDGRAGELDQEIDQRLEDRAARQKEVQAKTQANGQSDSVGATSDSRDGADTGVAVASVSQGRSDVRTDVDVPAAPFFGDRLVEQVALAEIYPYINKIALYRGQWQFRKGNKSNADYAAQLEDEVDPIFDRLCKQCAEENILQPGVVYGYFPCQSQDEQLYVYDPQDPGRRIAQFSFPRQTKGKYLCISDFFRSVDSGQMDVIGMTCVTVGSEVSVRARQLFEANNYTEYLYLHGFGVECAEALAELWHKRMRQELGIANDDATSMRKLIGQGYRGSRYSFGYPACPDMADQEKLFALLDPGRIGCVLTENWQIDPEQSTSAIVVHHPQAGYFNV